MKKFRNYILDEAVKSSNIMQVSKLIGSYLNKKIRGVYFIPSLDRYKTPEGLMTTLSYIVSDKIVRFNWKGTSVGSEDLYSICVNSGNGVKWVIHFDKEVSLAKILPQICGILKKPMKAEKVELVYEEVGVEIEDGIIVEADVADPLAFVKGEISKLSNGDKVATSSYGQRGGSMAYKLVRDVIANNPKAFEKNRLIAKAQIDWTTTERLFTSSRGYAKVSLDRSKEQWVQPPGLAAMETAAEEQISYIEKIADLANMLRFMHKGATNAVFVAGRGGTGKTQTVEDTLDELGLSDGSGYFKITGSASPAAIYETLYKNKKGVVLFDDCDGALDSQDGRNLIKAATDTKHVRKVSWLKKGGNYYDPDQEGDRDEDGGVGDDLPRFFLFTGKVIFISNLGINKLDPDGALRTRGMMIEMNPTNVEMYEFMQLIYNKIKLSGTNSLSEAKRKEVVKALRKIIESKAEETVNLRLLVRALNLASTGLPDWERMLKYS